MTEYCAVIGMHSTVWGDKLLYGQIPDPFPRCGIGSGHARLRAKVGCVTSVSTPVSSAHSMFYMMCITMQLTQSFVQ